MKLKVMRLLLVPATLMLLVACGGAAEPEVDIEATVEVKVQAVLTAVPTATSTPTPTPTPTCSQGEVQDGTTACGLNGDGVYIQTCVDGDWVDDETNCNDTNICVNDETKTGETPCGVNGIGHYDQTCGNGQWSDDDSNCIGSYEGQSPFAFMDTSNLRVPVWSDEIGGHVPNPNDPREQVVIDETFTVAAGGEHVFDDKVIWVRPTTQGDILIFGTLRITNSLLIWDQTEHHQSRLRIKNGGSLYVKDSHAFWGNKFWVNWEFHHGATVRLDNFVGNPWTTLNGSVDYEAINFSTTKMTIFAETNGSTIKIENAHHAWLELFAPPSDTHLEITFPEKMQWIDLWDLSSIWPNTTLTITNSYLYERDISLSNGTHVTVKDTPSGFSMGWIIANWEGAAIDCELRDLGNPDDNHGVLYELKTWNLPCNDSSLTLENSRLERVWPTFMGNVNLAVYNSNMVDTRVFGDETTYKVFNSTIDLLGASDGAQVYLENSQVRKDLDIKGTGTTVYGYNVTSRDEEFPFSVLTNDGGQYIELTSPGAPF